MFCSNFHHGNCYAVVACEIKMMAQRVETYRLRGGNIIMRSLCHVTKGAKSDALVFSEACRKGLPKQSYWVNLFHVSLVGRCTGDLIIALKTWKSQIFMICHLTVLANSLMTCTWLCVYLMLIAQLMTLTLEWNCTKKSWWMFREMHKHIFIDQWLHVFYGPVYTSAFRFKTHNFCYGYAYRYTTPAFPKSKTETFENAADPVLVWKLQGCVSV